MNSLLISCTLIICLLDVIHTESEESKESNCYEKYLNQSRLERLCRNEVYNETEMLEALDTNLVQYSGDDAAVHAVAIKYCPVINHVLDCTLIGDNIDAECNYPLAAEINRQRYDLYKAILYYVCANNASVMIRVLQNHGLQTIYDNKLINSNFKQCFKLMNTDVPIEANTLRATTELCNGVDRGFECYTNFVRNHKNSNLVTIANEFNIIFRQSLKCSERVVK